MSVNAVKCFRCDAELENVMSRESIQPMGGLAFRSYGHYGTSVFDPMNDTYVEIAICDVCLRENVFEIYGTGAIK